MASILFVHGTGVRKEAYQATFAVIEQKLATWPQALKPCLWGDTCGAQYPVASLPDPDPRQSGEFPLWSILAEDPLYELQLLAPPQTTSPAAQSGVDAWERIRQYQPSSELDSVLSLCGMKSYWQPSWTALIENNELAERALTESPEDESDDAACAVARAVTAALLGYATQSGAPALPVVIRQRIFQQLVQDWDCQSRGAISEIWQAAKEKLGFALDMAGSSYAGRHRNDIVPPLGDILLYQGRGQKIRAFIREKIERCAKDGPVVLLTHSLGGIATLDLLIESPNPAVTHLITAGSQAPYLYEMNAMVSLERNQLIPKPFPPWMNFYDPNDLLSYRAEPIFGSDRVTDVRVSSGLPSLHAHSAYWQDDEHVWTRIKDFLK